MKIKLKYGESFRILDINSENVLGILAPKYIPPKVDPYSIVKNALKKPVGKGRLKEIIDKQKPENIVIIASDITRPGPFNILLEVLVDEITKNGYNKSNIEFLIANGTHRKMTKEEMRIQYGDKITDEFQIKNHDCRANDLINLGKMSSGNELRINRTAAQSDFIIATGVINPHYFAGFSGARKSILPGICGYETIRANHANIIDDYSRLGVLKNNSINLEMVEAANKVGVDYCVNMILNNKRELYNCYAGDVNKVFQKGIKEFKKTFSVKFNKYVDVIFASAGGYPKDISFYQTQSKLNNIIGLLKENGTIVILTECRENIGQDEMEKALQEAKSLEELFAVKKSEIQIGAHRAFATGKLLKKADILVLSSMPAQLVRDIHFIPVNSCEEALDYIKNKHGNNFRAYVVPNSGMFFPVLTSKNKHN